MYFLVNQITKVQTLLKMLLPKLARGINNAKQSLPCQWNVLTIAGCSKYLTRNGIRLASSSAGSRLTLGHGVSVVASIRLKTILNFCY